MITSDKKRTFDLIVDKLNENTKGVTFAGNFMFRFSRACDYNFEIISRDTDQLEYSTAEYIPVVDVQDIETPYVQLNKQKDYEREFYIALEIEDQVHETTGQQVLEFDYTDNRYQAILEVLANFEDELTFIDGDYKYSFKVRQPKKVNIFSWNSKYYQILSLTMNLSSVESGFFGNETKLYLGLESDASFDKISDYQIDFMELNEVMSKSMTNTSSRTSDDESKRPIKRTWEATVTANFNGNTADLLLYKEKANTADLRTLYQVLITNANLNNDTGEDYDYTFDVYVSSVNISYQNNMVDRITFTLERA